MRYEPKCGLKNELTNLRVDADILGESDRLKLKSLNTLFCQEFLGVSTLDQTRV